MHNKDEILSTLRTAVCKTPDIAFALLFGSAARTRGFGFNSDIDIAAAFDPAPDLLQTGSIISELESALNCKVDLVMVKDIARTHPKLAYNIYSNHTIVCMNDETAYRRFMEETLHGYMDFKHVIDDAHRSFAERIRLGTLGKTRSA